MLEQAVRRALASLWFLCVGLFGGSIGGGCKRLLAGRFWSALRLAREDNAHSGRSLSFASLLLTA